MDEGGKGHRVLGGVSKGVGALGGAENAYPKSSLGILIGITRS